MNSRFFVTVHLCDGREIFINVDSIMGFQEEEYYTGTVGTMLPHQYTRIYFNNTSILVKEYANDIRAFLEKLYFKFDDI